MTDTSTRTCAECGAQADNVPADWTHTCPGAFDPPSAAEPPIRISLVFVDAPRCEPCYEVGHAEPVAAHLVYYNAAGRMQPTSVRLCVGCATDPDVIAGLGRGVEWETTEVRPVIAGGSECDDCGAAPDPDFEPQADHVVRCPDCAAARWHDLKIIRGTYSNGRPSYHAECPCGWQMVGTADEESARSIGSHHAFLELGADAPAGPIIAGGSFELDGAIAAIEPSELCEYRCARAACNFFTALGSTTDGVHCARHQCEPCEHERLPLPPPMSGSRCLWCGAS